MRCYSAALVVVLCGLARPSVGQEALRGAEKFPEFRNLSGLSGGGFGVDWRGYSSTSGATALSTPIAYVLGHGRFAATVAQMSNSGMFNLGTRAGNGTAAGTLGLSAGRWNVAISDMVLSTDLNQAFNIQAGYTPAGATQAAFSAGVQDLRGGGGSAGTGFPGDARTSRSLFGAVTLPVGTRGEPVYVSAGLGTRRFKNGFASASYRVLSPLRIYAEYDGFGLNEGVLTSWPMQHNRAPLLNVGVALVKSEYLTLYGGIAF